MTLYRTYYCYVFWNHYDVPMWVVSVCHLITTTSYGKFCVISLYDSCYILIWIKNFDISNLLKDYFSSLLLLRVSFFCFFLHHPCFTLPLSFLCTQQSMLHSRKLQKKQTGDLLKRFPPLMRIPQVTCTSCVVTVTGEHMIYFFSLRDKVHGFLSIFHINAPCCSSWRRSSTCHVRKPLFWISHTRHKHPEQTPSLTVIHYLKQPIESVINGKSSAFHLRDHKWVSIYQHVFYEIN